MLRLHDTVRLHTFLPVTVRSSNNHVGVALRLLRKSAGLTLDDVSRVAGISAPYLSNVENGNAEPSAKWVHMLIDAIGSDVSRKAAA